jgi:hypothetical protein
VNEWQEYNLHGDTSDSDSDDSTFVDHQIAPATRGEKEDPTFSGRSAPATSPSRIGRALNLSGPTGKKFVALLSSTSLGRSRAKLDFKDYKALEAANAHDQDYATLEADGYRIPVNGIAGNGDDYVWDNRS